MTRNPNNQPLEDARTVRILARELRRLFSATPQVNRRQSVIPAEDVSGYTDEDGYHAYAVYGGGGGYDAEGMR